MTLRHARVSATGLMQAAFPKNQSPTSQMTPEVDRIGNYDCRIAAPAPFGQPEPESSERERREVPEVDEMHRGGRRLV
jgi:hypothetical protein